MVLAISVDRIAAERDYHPKLCPGCKGNRVAKVEDRGSPGGIRIENPCSSCMGYGRLWTHGESPSTTWTEGELTELLIP